MMNRMPPYHPASLALFRPPFSRPFGAPYRSAGLPLFRSLFSSPFCAADSPPFRPPFRLPHGPPYCPAGLPPFRSPFRPPFCDADSPPFRPPFRPPHSPPYPPAGLPPFRPLLPIFPPFGMRRPMMAHWNPFFEPMLPPHPQHSGWRLPPQYPQRSPPSRFRPNRPTYNRNQKKQERKTRWNQ